jgi:RNA polymerase sigma-70 factor, ECF subfamily
MSASATLCLSAVPRPEGLNARRIPATEGRVEREIEVFLKSVEKRAFRIAELTLRNPDDALDVVQDAMLQLVRHYAERPAPQWTPLFYQILKNRIRDAQRRRRTRNRFVAWWVGGVSDEEAAPDPIESAVSEDLSPPDELAQTQAMGALGEAVRALPTRQREAFLWRALEGLDVATTAQLMGCSEGSVKTHYFRALAQLRDTLGEHRT